MQRLFIAVIFCLIGPSVFAQVRIVVLDKLTGKVLEGASIYIRKSAEENQTVASSDQNGSTELSIEKFPVQLVVSHIGFVDHQIEVLSAGEKIVALEYAVTELEEFVVTGQYETTSVKQSVFKVRVLDAEQLKAKGAVNLQGALNTELNISFSQDQALGVSTVSMQGLPGQNVKVLINGVPMIGRQGTTNAIDLNQININTIQSVEIVEGPMSTMYGADALAGVINIITTKPVQNKLSGAVKIHEENIGNEYSFFKEGIHQENVTLGCRWKSIYTMADFGHAYSGGWKGDSTDREKQWHPKAQWLASGTVGVERDAWNLSYRLDFLNEDIYNPANVLGNEALDQHYITNRFMHQLQSSAVLTSKLDLTTVVAYTDYQRKTQTIAVDGATGEETLSLSGQDVTKYDGVTIRGTLQYKINNKISLQPGYDINLESGSGGRLAVGTNKISDYAVFLSAELKPFKILSIRPGVRFVKNSVYEAPPVLSSINTKFQLSDRHDLRLSYGRGFRAPSLRELYFYFYDTNHQIEGNPDLEAELSNSFNASWNWQVIRKSTFSYETVVSGFYNKLNNMIDTGLKGGNITTYLNIEEYKTEGITFSNSIQSGQLSLTAGLAYTGRYNRYTDADNSTPDFTWSLESNTSLNYNFKKAGVSASFFYKYTGRTPYYAVTSTDEVYRAEAADYHWADLSVQKTFIKQLNLVLGIHNLFDVVQIANSGSESGTHSGGGSNLISTGRSFYTTIAFNF